jgi:hypothetical protein
MNPIAVPCTLVSEEVFPVPADVAAMPGCEAAKVPENGDYGKYCRVVTGV